MKIKLLVSELVKNISLIILTIAILVAIIAGAYLVGHFVSQIWLDGNVEDYPILSEIFAEGVDANIASGVLTAGAVLAILAITAKVLLWKWQEE